MTQKFAFIVLIFAIDGTIRHPCFLMTIRKKDGIHVYAEVYYNPRAVHKYLDVELAQK